MTKIKLTVKKGTQPDGRLASSGSGQMDTLIFIPPGRILDDPQKNIRVHVGDCSDIEPSIKRDGIQEPLWIRQSDQEGFYFLIEGYRRRHVARKLKLAVVPAILKDVDQRSVVRLMLVSDLKKKQPAVVLNKAGEIIGGLAYATVLELNAGTSRTELARLMNVTTDTIGAYVALHDEPVEVKKKVASGQWKITVYSRMKKQPEAFKKALARSEKKITAKAVREEIRKASGGVSDMPYVGETAVSGLASILATVQNLNPGNLNENDVNILWEIRSVVDQILKEGDQ